MLPPLLLTNPEGTITDLNDPASRTLEAHRGQSCADAVGARDGDGVPICSALCAAGQTRGATQLRDRPSVRVGDRWFRLVCQHFTTVRAVQLFEQVGDDAPADLTPREQQVMQLVAEGLTSARIATELGIAPATVRTHVEHVREKLGARTRAEAVARLRKTP
jgi:DNA-binding CsgD family transcriptional regulator